MCESLLDKDFLFVSAVDKMCLLMYSVGVPTLLLMCLLFHLDMPFSFLFCEKGK